MRLHGRAFRIVTLLGLTCLQTAPRTLDTVWWSCWTRESWESWERRRWLSVNVVRTTVPCWQTMVEAKELLGRTIHRHLMTVLTSHLSECTNTLMDPLVAVNLLTATLRVWLGIMSWARSWTWRRTLRRTWSWDWTVSRNDSVNLLLRNVSNLMLLSIMELQLNEARCIHTYLRRIIKIRTSMMLVGVGTRWTVAGKSLNNLPSVSIFFIAWRKIEKTHLSRNHNLRALAKAWLDRAWGRENNEVFGVCLTALDCGHVKVHEGIRRDKTSVLAIWTTDSVRIGGIQLLGCWVSPTGDNSTQWNGAVSIHDGVATVAGGWRYGIAIRHHWTVRIVRAAEVWCLLLVWTAHIRVWGFVSTPNLSATHGRSTTRAAIWVSRAVSITSITSITGITVVIHGFSPGGWGSRSWAVFIGRSQQACHHSVSRPNAGWSVGWRTSRTWRRSDRGLGRWHVEFGKKMIEFGEMNTRDGKRDGTNRSNRGYTVLYNRPYVGVFPNCLSQIQISHTWHTNVGSILTQFESQPQVWFLMWIFYLARLLRGAANMFGGRPAAACNGILHVTAISFRFENTQRDSNKQTRKTNFKKGLCFAVWICRFWQVLVVFSISEGSIAMWWHCFQGKESKQKELGAAESSSWLNNRKWNSWKLRCPNENYEKRDSN